MKTTLSRQKILSDFKKNYVLYLYLIPAIVILVLFSYIPMYGVIIAFKDFNPMLGFSKSPWVGLKWFEFVVNTPSFHYIIRNTLVISIMKIILGQIVPIIFTILLNEVRKSFVKKTIQTMVYLPHFISWVIVGGMFIDLLSTKGIVNQMLGFFGVEPLFFLGDNKWFQFTIVSTDIWKSFGWGSILYLAALTNINSELYEAAIIDGANRLQQIIYITLPGIRSTIVLLAALSLGDVLNAGFEQILILYNPAVYETGDILDTFVYRQGLVDMQFSLATAVGLFKSVIGFFLIVLSNKIAYKYADYRIF